MTTTAALDSEASRRRGLKQYVALLGLVVWIVALVPPVSTWASHYGYVQALQFCLFCTWIPVALVVGAPWIRLGLISSEHSSSKKVPVRSRPLDGVLARRGAGGSYVRTVSEVSVFVALVIAWRTTPFVDALVRHPWLALVESVTLVGSGVLLWLDLVESLPFRPGATRPFRIGMSAISMWTIWVVAYFLAMSHDVWYRVFLHAGSTGVSQSAEQQFTAAIMWFSAALVFIPVVFWNLNQWLRAEDDPDEELYQMVRQERHRGFFGSK